jgi:mRNA interferase RelE/StbE
MIKYDKEILKNIKKGKLPGEIFIHFHNAFTALDATGDLTLFDIKKLKTAEKRSYYRLRKGKYRAIFYIEDKEIRIMAIDVRGEVYKKWL